MRPYELQSEVVSPQQQLASSSQPAVFGEHLAGRESAARALSAQDRRITQSSGEPGGACHLDSPEAAVIKVTLCGWPRLPRQSATPLGDPASGVFRYGNTSRYVSAALTAPEILTVDASGPAARAPSV